MPKSTLPKLSAPLKAGIRTSEGILVYLVNTVIGVGAIVEPGVLPPKYAAIVVGVTTIAHSFSRTLLKIFALQVGITGIPAPADVASLPSDAVERGVQPPA